MDNSMNIFTPVDWGSTIEMEGFTWKPIGKLRLKNKAEQEVMLQDGVVCWAGAVTQPGHNETLQQFRSRTKALLPSATFVNSQPSPRHAALTALCMAGFIDEGQGHILFEFSPDAHIAINQGNCKTVSLSIYTCDRDMAQTAVTAFTILQEWVDMINWDAKKEQENG